MAKKDIIKHKKGEVIYEAKIEGQEKDWKDYKWILAVIIFAIVFAIIVF